MTVRPATTPIALGRILNITVKALDSTKCQTGERAVNIGRLRPMDYFSREFSHNVNLASQFGSMQNNFLGSRAVRGDGNCYYRAVLFSWLEYALREQDTTSLQSFHDLIGKYTSNEEERASTRHVQTLLLEWRRRCVWHAVDVDGLLEEMVAHFNDCYTDLAFIRLFRWTIRDYILENQSRQCAEGLSLASWADSVLQGGIQTFCTQVETMHEEAFDLVQFVAPQVLCVTIRIVLVDRNQKDAVVVDYSPTLQVGTKTSSSVDLKLLVNEPQVFLLFRPGHYDVLTPLQATKPTRLYSLMKNCFDCLEHRMLCDSRQWDEETRLMFGVQLKTVLEPLEEAIHAEGLLQRLLSSIQLPPSRQFACVDACSLCMEANAASAPCGCRFHAHCLRELVRITGDGKPLCAAHNTAIPDFLHEASSKRAAKTVLNLHEFQPPKRTPAPIEQSVVPAPIKQLAEMPAESPVPEMRSPVPEKSWCQVKAEPAAPQSMPCCLCWNEDDLQGAMCVLPCCGFAVHKRPCLIEFWKQGVRATMIMAPTCACPAGDTMGCPGILPADFVDISEAEIQAMHTVMKELAKATQALITQYEGENVKVEDGPAVFACSICFEHHEVDGSCTLPCGHRFCFDSLRQHFSMLVKERRLDQLQCPVVECHDMVDVEVLRGVLERDVFEKLLEFMTRDLRDPHIIDCPKCEERIWVADEDDQANLICPQRHAFCANCRDGPHPRFSCEERKEELQKHAEEAEHLEARKAQTIAMELGWKPCPKRCKFGGGFKASEECDHVTCQCGFEFCWMCGVDRNISYPHDNRWHQTTCPYYTERTKVSEEPAYSANCPACKALGHVCPFPEETDYPEGFV